MALIVGIFLGFILGYIYKGLKSNDGKKIPKKERQRNFNYMERQQVKTRYESDTERIRQLNLLNTNESKFMRLLQHEFNSYNIVAKNRRFYVADKEMYPIAIFEYRDSKQVYISEDKEDGLPIFLYKGIISQNEIQKAYEKINKNLI